MRRRSVLAGAVAAAGAVTLGLNPAANAQRPGASAAPELHLGDLPVVARVRAGRAMEHLKVLSERIGQRIGGTESEHRARDYLAGVLRKLRYDVELQPFTVPDKYLATLTLPDGTAWNAASSRFGALDTSASGPLLDLDTGATLPDDLTGKVVLLVNVPAGSTAVLDAAARGAKAILIGRVSTPPAGKTGAFSPTLTGNVTVPVLGVAQVHVERLRAAKPATITVATTHHPNLTSYNVLAERPGTFGRDNGVVMVTAHYDSVPGSPGANDDGSGTVLALELARVLRHLPTHKALRFALWGSEEQGLLGSRHYVSQLTDPDAARIAGVFQNDMVATSHGPATAYWLLSVDGGDNATTQEVAAAAGRLGYGAQVHGPVARGSSDHVPFHERKIAAANFSWRGEGGPHQLEPLYHTPEDTIELNVSPERLQVSLELIGAAAYRLACRRS